MCKQRNKIIRNNTSLNTKGKKKHIFSYLPVICDEWADLTCISVTISQFVSKEFNLTIIAERALSSPPVQINQVSS